MPKRSKVWYLMRKFVSRLWETGNCNIIICFLLVAATYENWSPPLSIQCWVVGGIVGRGTPWILVSDPKTHPSNKVTSKRIFKQSFSLRDTNDGYQSAFKPQQIFKKKFFPNYSLNTNINVGTLKVWLEVIG